MGGYVSAVTGSIYVRHDADSYQQVHRWARALLDGRAHGFAMLTNPAPAPKDENRPEGYQYMRQSEIAVLMDKEGFAGGWAAFTEFCGNPWTAD